ncbi:LmbE-like protein [Metschnikowia bicuspidata var. bicuspidata NRRL YB-4993]|uniref:N-acetylglucosaminylphosphatidylinositol deacetylase n=1 Tax=Metschnikowia bicuspidata var. bicuspidata NRRL YB-4993 TaxID=869754 RepID=A0A1A0HFI5_9ASCO|nr:LmbE-like protein [Metschnikowia bicuspidata var. bicuspidata NRRL YB-4993]OBA22761.1 LmbE-like protein [Metschnikowia bicuspidata var. bicuspidata NRRL YB-4993]
MLFLVPKFLVRLFLGSFALWIILSTAIPQLLLKFLEPQIRDLHFTQTAYPYNSLTTPAPPPIRNSTVVFVIGHPDDEVMFFSPSLVELAKPKHHNRIKLLCFSRGDAVDVSFGGIRAQELRSSARIIGVEPHDVVVLDEFQDGMDVQWKAADVAETLRQQIGRAAETTVVITFDEQGVSSHPNHISLYHGCKEYFQTHVEPHAAARLYVLKSLNFWEKYSFTALTNVELLVDLVLKFFLNTLKININVSFFSAYSGRSLSSIKFYSDLNMLSLSYAAMAYGHYSQMVWFRYGWLMFSRYLTFNHLIQLH